MASLLIDNNNNTTTTTTTTTTNTNQNNNNVNTINNLIDNSNDHLSITNILSDFEELPGDLQICISRYFDDDILAMINVFAKTSTKFLKFDPLRSYYFIIVLPNKYVVRYGVDFNEVSAFLRHKNLTDDDALAIGEELRTNNTLEFLQLRNNNITDVQSIGEALKTNNTLTELYLYNNNITDDSGIQSIIDGLKTNNTLKRLELDNNQLSDNMISQLNAIEQYKRDGSNGYQQVKGMEIYR